MKKRLENCGSSYTRVCISKTKVRACLRISGASCGSERLHLADPAELQAARCCCPSHNPYKVRPLRMRPRESGSSDVASVTARLEASRLEDRRQARGRHPLRHHPAILSSSDPGTQFSLSEEMRIHASLFNKKSMAGPPPPQSWWREAQEQQRATAQARKKREEEKSRQAMRLVSASSSQGNGRKEHKMRSSLREECIAYILADLAGQGFLMEEVPFLPMHVKESILALAPRIAPLSDESVQALLLPFEEEDTEPQPESSGGSAPILPDTTSDETGEEEEGYEAEEWEKAGSGEDFDYGVEERRLAQLELSHSSVSLRTLRRLFLADPNAALQKGAISRLPRLRKLSLSHAQHSSVSLSPPFITLLSSLIALDSLSLAGISSSLYSPLYSLSTALPSLRELDLSHSSWLKWSDLARVDWGTTWTSLENLTLAGCEQLIPPASFMDPEPRPAGPGLIMHAMSIIREKGRKRWLEIVA